MLNEVISWVNTVSQGNQMIAGAITLALSGMVGFMFTRLPSMIMHFIKVQFVTSLTLNNTDWAKRTTFIKVTTFLHSKTTERGSRSLSFESGYIDGENVTAVTVGYGNHFFWYRGRLMWLNKSKLDSSGSENMKEEITIKVLGRKHDIFHQLLADNTPDKKHNMLTVSVFEDKEWRVQTKIPKTGLDKLALNPETRAEFINDFDYFISNEETYTKLNLPYKMTIALHGLSGSGKTSVIRALASDYNMNVCLLPLVSMTDASFYHAVTTAPKNSIIVIEDFDSCTAVSKRSGITGDSNPPPSDKPSDMEEISAMLGISLSGILNTLDGIASLHGNIIFMTTNCISKVDPALLRSGRIDKVMELPIISKTTVKDYFIGLYGSEVDVVSWPELNAKDINGIIFKAKDDVSKVKQYLKGFNK